MNYSCGMFQTLDGQPIERTPESHPYSYEEYVLWKKEYKEEKARSVYSDRLRQQDHQKEKEVCLAVFGDTGQYFNNRKPEDVERYLSKLLDIEIKLTAILEACNVSSGYPYWRFCYEEIE